MKPKMVKGILSMLVGTALAFGAGADVRGEVSSIYGMIVKDSKMFIALDGIKGESVDEDHVGWIDVLDVSLAEDPVDRFQREAVGRRGRGKPFSFVHLVDRATSKIQQFCMNDQLISSCRFHVCRTVNDKRIAVFEVKLENVRIESARVKMPESTGDERADPIEEVSLLCGSITWRVLPVELEGQPDELDGSLVNGPGFSPKSARKYAGWLEDSDGGVVGRVSITAAKSSMKKVGGEKSLCSKVKVVAFASGDNARSLSAGGMVETQDAGAAVAELFAGSASKPRGSARIQIDDRTALGTFTYGSGDKATTYSLRAFADAFGERGGDGGTAASLKRCLGNWTVAVGTEEVEGNRKLLNGKDNLVAHGEYFACHGLSSFMIAIGAKGRARVKGHLGDGTPFSVKSTLLSVDGVCCLPVSLNLYTGKKGGTGFLLWFYGNDRVEISNAAAWKADLFTAEEFIGGVEGDDSGIDFISQRVSGNVTQEYYCFASMVARVKDMFATQTDARGRKVYPDCRPVDGILDNNRAIRTASVNTRTGATTWGRAPKITIDRDTGVETVVSNGNDYNVKLTYRPGTGEVTGRMTIYLNSGTTSHKLKTVKCKFNGVMVGGGVGACGSVVIPEVGVVPFTFEKPQR